MRSSEPHRQTARNRARRNAAGTAVLAASLVFGLLWPCTGAAQTAPVATGAAAVYTQVELVGERGVADADLRRALDLPVRADSLPQALRRLAGVLFDRGYLEATVTPEPAPDTVLRLRVRSGAQARVAHLFWRGTETLTANAAEQIVGLEAGSVFAPLVLETGLQRLVEVYARRGYLQAMAVVERLELDAQGVIVGIAVAEGPLARLSEVQVQGNTHSRSTLVQRLSGLGPASGVDLRRLHESTLLLRRSGLFAAVEEPLVYRAGGEDLGVMLRVVEPQQRNAFFGSIGVAQDPHDSRAYLASAIDLQLRNIWGTGRDLTLAWKRDALSGSALAVGYRERFLFGWRLDLIGDLAQTVRDSTYTFQSAGAAVVVPLRTNLGLEVGGAFDRSVFHTGRTGEAQRWRARTGLIFESLSSAGDRHPYGRLEVRAEYALQSNDIVGSGTAGDAHFRQTVWSGRFECGVPLGLRHELWSRGTWNVLFSDESEVAASELYYFGGARTLRGYREEQFRGDQVAYGGVEYRFGDPRGARLYAFVDAGGLRRKQDGAATVRETHLGYGLGLRGPFASGLFDIAFGLGEERSWSGAKLHVALLQRF